MIWEKFCLSPLKFKQENINTKCHPQPSYNHDRNQTWEKICTVNGRAKGQRGSGPRWLAESTGPAALLTYGLLVGWDDNFPSCFRGRFSGAFREIIYQSAQKDFNILTSILPIVCKWQDLMRQTGQPGLWLGADSFSQGVGKEGGISVPVYFHWLHKSLCEFILLPDPWQMWWFMVLFWLYWGWSPLWTLSVIWVF